MKFKEYTITKYVCDRCNTEYDDSLEIKPCQLCGIDMCDSDECELTKCEVTTCGIDVCYNCSKVEKEEGCIVCNNCFTKKNMTEAVI